MPTASVVGILRVRSDKHYATDVLTGAGVGMALGWVTPKLVLAVSPRTAARGPDVEPIVSQSTAGVQVALAW